MMGRRQGEETATGTSGDGLAVTITRGSLVVLVLLGFAAGIIIPLAAGGLKVVTGDYPPGAVMLLFAGFMVSVLAAWLIRRYRDRLVVLGISSLTLMGIVWAVFEDGYGPKAFMVSLVVTAGFMAALGFYNVFLKKRPIRSM